MFTTVRRLFWLGALGGGGYAAYTTWRRRTAPDLAPAPVWPPLEPRSNPADVPHPADTRTDTRTDIEVVSSDTVSQDASSHDVISPNTISPDTVSQEAGEGAGRPPAFPAPIAWMPPVDGACPDGYPVKANDNSGIYHVPGGSSYERTVPERCYANTAAAEADGYRAVKG